MNNKINLNWSDNNVTLLSKNEMKNINGGFLHLVLAAAGVYAAINVVAYGAGALYGLLTKE